MTEARHAEIVAKSNENFAQFNRDVCAGKVPAIVRYISNGSFSKAMLNYFSEADKTAAINWANSNNMCLCDDVRNALA